MKSVFAAILFLGTSIFYTYVVRNSNPTDVAFYKTCQTDHIVDTGLSDFLTRPSCMKKWLSNYDQGNISIDSIIPDCHHVANAAMLKYKVDSHLPHFSSQYFSFLSFALSENSRIRLHCTTFNKMMQHLIVDDEKSRLFWKSNRAVARGTAELIEVVDRNWRTKTITSSSCLSKHPNSYVLANNEIDLGWFYYPADATLLGSMILRKNPCEWHGKAETILNENTSFTILNRKSDRKLLNFADIISVIHDMNRRKSEVYTASTYRILFRFYRWSYATLNPFFNSTQPVCSKDSRRYL